MTDEAIASAEARLLAAKIDELEKRISENRRKGERQHEENSARLDRIDRVITDHAADDKAQLGELNIHAVTTESQLHLLNAQIGELLTLVKLTSAMQTVGSFMRGAIVFATPFVVLFAAVYALYLYIKGRAPFPFP